jgi:hypothetical protein
MDSLSNKIKEIARGKKFILVPTPGGEENESDVTYVPDFEILLLDINRALETLRAIVTDPQVINDPKFGEIYNQFRVLRNNLRTHMRTKYPSEYQKIKGMFEMTGTGGGGVVGGDAGASGFQVGQGPQYGPKFAYKLAPKIKKLDETNPGASLGKGPKAGPKGVTNNYYTKNFKYKLVNPVKLAAQSKAVDTKYLWGKP